MLELMLLRVTILSLFLSLPSLAGPFDKLAEELAKNTTLVDVSAWEGLELDVRYATENNFTGSNVYGNFDRCFLHAKAAEMFKRAQAALRQQRPKWKFLVFDCLRPRRAQAVLFKIVKGTPQERYVISPKLGSMHNYGFAMDLSLSDEQGNEVDMGTEYDHFGALSEPKYEDNFVRSSKLSRQQLENRLILRSAMKTGGFRPISNEWWHFDGLPGAEVRAKYKIIE